MIRFATIGTSFITDWFVKATLSCEKLEYAAVYSRTRQKGEDFASKYGVSLVYDNLEELAMDESIDMVYIASPPSCHFMQSVLMLNYGKHVLCEKPAMSNTKELELVLEAARENGGIFLEAMKPLFTPGFRLIEENLSSLGKIRRVTLQRCRRSVSYDEYLKGEEKRVFMPKFSTGALMDFGCYAVAMLVKLFGMPEKIFADAILLDTKVDGAGSIFARYPNMQAEILYSKMADSRVESQIQGEEACMLIPNISHPREIKIITNDGRIETKKALRIEAEEERNNLVYEILEFLRLIEERQALFSYNEATKMELKLMDEARRQMGIVFPADRILEDF